MGLDIEFTFANGKTVDAHMCYSSFLPRILANFTQEQLKDFNLNWIGDEPIPVILFPNHQLSNHQLPNHRLPNH